ncbi:MULTISPECIES: purine-nucleoside phosphorylase [Brevibacillus]|jgi:purine-nucleoside phosphorylase|uniref:Purine nucleoside phosphorylase n=1 Tax=Brevibacillus parabrevis TaxID=54914 RepID=A0A4Y3PB72_BREPA|nr:MULTISPECIES: purine-nucleoside phosphorylase [Brevibacillus]MBU8712071.1 purine-nucleoside phosphorylase [Brevibacillus parabrevis]MDH6349138.1 purine-nucleoside phosphorylase [Brevibacillus sp. 1238]MDR5001154.1 purine-nucleoside phosphorylase [Brevibacillus parabrevis]MED1724130.1 purine-nucleoside phosphorylase [Brevibacillus parabrevis]MED2257589.1 purine-nucleoside phosphorylase [Brevibacillus parabrevis]
MANLHEAVAFIEPKLSEKPTIGLVLGSGLGVLADEIENPVVIPYHEIPGFTVSTVVGHKGQLVIGKLQGKQVVAMQGRFHFYEGHGLDAVVFPIRVMKLLGVETIIVTNAAGGINEGYDPGDLMLISDHLNMTFRNPLIGPNDDELGARFPDMSEAYSKELRQLARQVASEQGINLREGVYVGLLGPSYETPAEIRMLRQLGGDAVGMSTVPEVIVARHMKVNVLGISCISNMAAGILEQPLSHDEVMETTEKVKAQFLALVNGIVAKL